MRRRLLLALLLTVAAAAATHGCGRAAAPPDPVFPAARRLEGLTGLENMGEVEPGLLRGAQPSGEGLARLKAMGVKTVLNLRHFHGGEEEAACRALGLDYVAIPLASSEAPTDGQVRRFLSLARDPARRPLFFHCQHGSDRTGTMCAVYRMEVGRWPRQAVLDEMDAFGFCPVWRALRAFVNAYVPGR